MICTNCLEHCSPILEDGFVLSDCCGDAVWDGHRIITKYDFVYDEKCAAADHAYDREREEQC